MKKSYVLIFIIIILLILIYFIGQKETEAAKVTVEIKRGAPFNAAHFNESERDLLIGDISLEKIYTKKLAIPKGSDMYMPGISVALFNNKMLISDWISVPIKEKGVYELTLGLKQPLKKGDIVRIAVYVNDDKGKVIIGKRSDVIWD